VRGTVTYYHPSSGRLFLQDSTGAIAVGLKGPEPGLYAGKQIAVEATTAPDDGAVSLRSLRITDLGRRSLPPAMTTGLLELAGAGLGPVRVTVAGVVQEAKPEGDHLQVRLVADNLEALVTISGRWPGPPDRLLDAKIAVTGVGEVQHGESPWSSPVHLWVAAPEDVVVQEAPRSSWSHCPR
jgi:hypothetical protein